MKRFFYFDHYLDGDFKASASNLPSNSPYTYTLPSTPSIGTHNATVTCTDRFVANYDEVNFTVTGIADGENPTITISYPEANKGYAPGEVTYFTFTPRDNAGTISSCTYKTGTGTNTTITGSLPNNVAKTVTAKIVYNNKSVNTLLVECKDPAGNEGQTTVSYGVCGPGWGWDSTDKACYKAQGSCDKGRYISGLENAYCWFKAAITINNWNYNISKSAVVIKDFPT